MPPKIKRMKKTLLKSLFVVSALLIFFAFNSCKKDNNDTTQADRETIEKYAADNNLNGQFTSSGLYYVIEKAGAGSHPNINSNITVSYKGYYLDGTILDQGDFFTARLYNLIRGWQEGIPLIGSGGEIKLVIPSYMAYNNGVLVFDVTLHYFSE